MNKELIKTEALKWKAWFHKGQKNWSVAHHITVFGSIILNVASGAVLQLKLSESAAIATVLTSLAVALSSMAAAGGFERKWRSNRLSRSRIDGLLIDLESECDSTKLHELTMQLKDIIIKHDSEIVGEQLKEDVSSKISNNEMPKLENSKNGQ